MKLFFPIICQLGLCMKKVLLVSLFAISFSVQADQFGTKKEWAAAGFKNPEITKIKSSLSISAKKFTHKIKILMVMLRNAGWTKSEVQKQFEWSAKTYAQCGMFFDESPLIIADSPTGEVDFSPGKNAKEDGLGKALPVRYRPVVFFVGKHSGFPSGYSYIRSGVAPPDRRLIDTAYISKMVLNSIIKLPYYNVVAHELAHILVDAGHNQEDPPDILSEPIPHADTITMDQCDIIKQYPTAVER